ncbi:hypothetical protein HL653_06755 [Sphingomonas sp. AP4-R1]|uniref:hypothetical protein n=1 Tax=Sphingomonas sp. AP4-R1 TaxID=2735134 RepID=UPI001493D6FB|nr:hypothetical protein [Sphingomonas sp. AP4-R1]QJU57529.1 hypothetical protein HL653_06755 [Sphingomonas sp. AP4-R1]
MKRLATSLLAAALVSAPLAAQTPDAAMGYSRQMASLTEIQRFAAIRRAIQDNGLWCPRVTAAAFQQPIKNLAMWVARCGAITPPQKTLAGTMPKSSETYGIFIGPDGTVQAGQCAEITKVKWPACRPLPAAPAPKKG